MAGYDNYTINRPDGEMMFRCSKYRFDWYVERGLAIVMEDKRATLTFLPAGDGDPEFMLLPRENKCVCCGTDEGLTSHHVVPRCFRIFMPSAYKDHNCYDIVLLCRKCHDVYEKKAWSLKHALVREHVPHDVIERSKWIIQGHKLSRTLMRQNHHTPLPESAVEIIKNKLIDLLTRLRMTEQELLAAEPDNEWQMVTKAVPIEDLIRKWKKHFVEVAEPKHLPAWWDHKVVRYSKKI